MKSMENNCVEELRELCKRIHENAFRGVNLAELNERFANLFAKCLGEDLLSYIRENICKDFEYLAVVVNTRTHAIMPSVFCILKVPHSCNTLAIKEDLEFLVSKIYLDDCNIPILPTIGDVCKRFEEMGFKVIYLRNKL